MLAASALYEDLFESRVHWIKPPLIRWSRPSFLFCDTDCAASSKLLVNVYHTVMTTRPRDFDTLYVQ
jgi:hypothetical protein